MAIADITKPMALDETLQGTNTALGLLVKDATISGITTALGLLGKDTSLQSIITALGLLNKDATMVTQNSKLDTIINKLQGIIEALGVDTSIYKAAGNKACADLTSSLLVAGNLGNVYNITDNGTTTADFVEGAGKPIHLGDNVAVVDIGEGGSHVYKFDLLSGLVDLSNYIQKSETAGLVKNDGTIDTKDYAEKVAGATSGNLAGLNASGNPTDSGWNGAKDTTSISGNPISISGLKANQLAVNPIITFEPIQTGSGTPSPSNIRAISGYDKIKVLSCGVNVWDEEWELGELNGQGQPAASTTKIRSKNYIFVIGGSTYYLKLSSESARVFICFYDLNKTFISSNTPYEGTFTVPPMARYCRFNCPTTYGTTYNNDMGINYPATQTSYVASNKTTDLSYSLEQTVYGGSLDVRTGMLTVDRAIADMGDLSWTYSAPSDFFYAYLSGMKAESMLICSQYENLLPTSEQKKDVTIGVINAGQIRCINRAYGTDAAAFKTAMVGSQMVYELATPFTIQLTPHEISLLKDYAYVSTNGTNITLDYHNGELASLSDVAQLGETVNELGEYFAYVENVSSKITMSSSALQNQLKAYKIGRFVHICLYTGAVASANTTITLGRVGAPLLNTNANVCGSIGAQTGNDVGAGSIVIDNSSGDIKLIYSKTTTYSLLVTFTYLLP